MSDDSHEPKSAAAGDFWWLADAARRARETSHAARDAAAKTRWRSRKAQLRARRVRKESAASRPRTLDEFVEVATVDELVNVLVDLAERDDRRHGNGS